MEIADRVVVVTGASSGIGAATARLAHKRGARVVLAARRAERLDELAGELPGSLAVPTDITQPEQVDHLIEQALAAFGPGSTCWSTTPVRGCTCRLSRWTPTRSARSSS